jgi:hypothetical protein
MGKGNGDDKAVENVKEQMAFLDEVKELAKKHGIKIGPGVMPKPANLGQRNLQVQVREQDGRVIIDFGQSISWMAMDVTQATKYAATIIKIVQGIQRDQSIQAAGGDTEPGKEAAADPDAEKAEDQETVDKPK